MSKKPLKWKPLFSFLSIGGLIFFGMMMYSLSFAIGIITGAGAVIAWISTVFGEHFKEMKNIWSDKVYTEVHTFFIWSFVVVCIGALVGTFFNYRPRISFEKIIK